ncbi:hypothetical protein RF11_13559 [Thelohanellus kitauei]|uniref:Uncharacterized protein n=1 Tax=Thelohanellus kitauei TaxID=669202 RepID=A0A0C2MNX7_THEKT|nr:hypothetical protein RF11_13559 [Thelohanellus kitauei]
MGHSHHLGFRHRPISTTDLIIGAVAVGVVSLILMIAVCWRRRLLCFAWRKSSAPLIEDYSKTPICYGSSDKEDSPSLKKEALLPINKCPQSTDLNPFTIE